MSDPPPAARAHPPPGTSSRSTTYSEWFNDEEEELMYLVLTTEEGKPLADPFIVGKSLQQHVGRPVVGNLINNRTKYLLKIRSLTHYKKLQSLTKLFDGPPTQKTLHKNPHLPYLSLPLPIHSTTRDRSPFSHTIMPHSSW